MDSQAASTSDFNLQKEAKRVFDFVLFDEPLNFFALYGKALTLYKEGKLEEAIDVMDQAVNLEPIDSGSNAKFMRDQIRKIIEKKAALNHVGRGTPENLLIRSLILRLPNIGERPAAEAQKNKSHTCKICEKIFTKQFSLNRHMHLHTGEKRHKCPVCGKAFIQKTDMERHGTTHSDVLNFGCTFKECEKRFRTQKNLKCHLVTHSTDTPFKCQFCDKSFKVKRLWRFHEGLHKDIKPYNCDLCGKGFPAKPYIKSHMKTHIDERPFACSICKSSFKRRYDLNVHVRKQHQKY